MKILLFKTNIDIKTDHATVSDLLDSEKRIMRWDLGNEDEFTVLFVMCSGLTEHTIEEMIKSLGFECEFWQG